MVYPGLDVFNPFLALAFLIAEYPEQMERVGLFEFAAEHFAKQGFRLLKFTRR